MQTTIPEAILATPDGRVAEEILRSCVHCGFCTATCPTYQLLGDELDSPRGRIYLIKQALEEGHVSRKTLGHLDRCLSCRSCETTCPSGVNYGRLVEIGRSIVESRVQRPLYQRAQRKLLRMIIPFPNRFKILLGAARLLRPLLPHRLQQSIPKTRHTRAKPGPRHDRTMLILDGCAQSIATPATNAATSRILDRLGISLIHSPGSGCCGALSHHNSAADEALSFARKNIDAWWPHIQDGSEAIVISASGCGLFVQEYGELLKHDPAYAEKAKSVSQLAVDVSELFTDNHIARLRRGIDTGQRIAFHSPCTLQHGLKLDGVVERILKELGFNLTEVADKHLCCGSAGTYSLLQPTLSGKLREQKVTALEAGHPDVIATGNVGCQLHLAAATELQIRHWVEIVDAALTP